METKPEVTPLLSPEAGEMLDRVRSSLRSRAEGINMGGDIEVMEAVDKIVKRETSELVARVEQLEAALKTVTSSLGDRLLGKGALSKEYAHATMLDIHKALATPSPAIVRQLFRDIVDIAWNEATESTTVPSTAWADRIIDRAIAEVQK